VSAVLTYADEVAESLAPGDHGAGPVVILQLDRPQPVTPLWTFCG